MKTVKQVIQENNIEPVWSESIIGIEKEGLRVNPDGTLATTDHPHTLGSRSHHPYIQTDFSEVQLELITPPLSSNKRMNRWLSALHDVTYHSMKEDELIWPLSMPGTLPAEEQIPIAKLENRPDVA